MGDQRELGNIFVVPRLFYNNLLFIEKGCLCSNSACIFRLHRDMHKAVGEIVSFLWYLGEGALNRNSEWKSC